MGKEKWGMVGKLKNIGGGEEMLIIPLQLIGIGGGELSLF